MAEASHTGTQPSGWVRRFAGSIETGGAVLDVACGTGRHARLFIDRGHPVVAIDRYNAGIVDLLGQNRFEFIEADLEDGPTWPLGERRFAAIVATNYLHRPLIPRLVEALAPGGVLIYETFARGNERHGRPRNPNFLLAPGELLAAVSNRLVVIAYEHGEVTRPGAAVIQRICAVNTPATGYSAAYNLEGSA